MTLRWIERKSLRILDWDSECRPMHYSEFRDESQITAIAWSWIGERKIEHEVLRQNLSNERRMLERFLKAYDEADILTGHFLVGHDLRLLTDHCIRFGWPLPAPKVVQDTKTLMPVVRGLGLSQENLSTLFELDEKKHRMNGRRWAVTNTLAQGGREEARQRCVRDVRQHKALRKKLVEQGYLDAPRRWSP